MPPKKQVSRLGDIAVVRVAELVSEGIVANALRCTPEELQRNVALLKSDICDCVPAPLYDDFAVNVLRTMSRLIEYVEVSEGFDYSILESPLMTVIDRLSIVKLFSEVSPYVMLILLRNLHKLKMLRNIELHDRFFNVIYMNSGLSADEVDRRRTWLEKCDLRFVEKLVCPARCFDNDTFSRLERCSRLKILTVCGTLIRSEMTNRIFDNFGGLSELRAVDVHKCGNMTDSITDLLLRNRNLRKLALCCDRDFSTNLLTTYPALNHLHVDCYATCKIDLATIAARFPNLISLKLETSQPFDPLVLPAFAHLSSLSLVSEQFPLADLWDSLTKIGHNIVTLELPEKPLSRSDMHFIYKNCRNCENLKVSYEPYYEEETLVVPPFQRLQRLNITIGRVPAGHEDTATYYLDFIQMPSLEYLEYMKFKISPTRLESILPNGQHFPRLKEIVPLLCTQEESDHIQRIIQQHNLDINFVPAYEQLMF